MLAKIRTAYPQCQPGMVFREELTSPQNHPVVLVTAPAGYGKSQLLALWCEKLLETRTVAYGLCSRLGETASTLLELLYTSLQLQERFQKHVPWQEQADSLLEALYELGPTTLILDDVHYLESDTSENQECRLLLSYLLDYRSEDCHWIFSGRSKPKLADLELGLLSGEIELLTAASLSLTRDLLEELSPGHGKRLFDLTSGWPMACSMLLKTDPTHWNERREKLGQGLLDIALRELSPEVQDAVAVLGLVHSATRADLEQESLWQLLQPLASSGTLVQIQPDDKLGVHPLFSEQFRERASSALKARAVSLLIRSQRAWEALELVRDGPELTELLLQEGNKLLAAGRLRLLQKLLERAQDEPRLDILRGRMNWHQGDPATALECFSRSAQHAQSVGETFTVYLSWRAAGQLYIDAVCPAEAQVYLKRAYRALGPTENQYKAQILELLAENAVNLGEARRASRYRRMAKKWDKQKNEDLALTARLLLRSGRLAEARGTVQVALEQEEVQRGLQGHREPRLVLSYICALEGLAQKAIELAEDVLQEAEEQNDPRSKSAALTRLAHGHLLLERSQPNGTASLCLDYYCQADSLARTLGLERLRAEPLMGQALHHLFQGNERRAYEACKEGVRLARESGDSWLSAWLNFVQAVTAIKTKDASGPARLQAVQAEFRLCRDRFGYALCDVWAAVSETPTDPQKLAKHLGEFPFLAVRPSLFSPAVSEVVAAHTPAAVETPAKLLQVFCLGPLSLIRDGEAVPSKAFKRKKARELFVLLLASPDTFFHREELAAQLWPEASQSAAIRDFRVALHALSDALEPQRPRNTTAFCIERQEERYRLLSHKVDLDSARFERLVASENNVGDWEKAVRLFRGPFCEDYRYLEALESIRRRFDVLYLQTATRLCETYLQRGQTTAATELSQKMLMLDATWEPAYRSLMRGQHTLGHEHLVPRTFTRCLETLEEQLGVEPSNDTFALARELLGDQLATLL